MKRKTKPMEKETRDKVLRFAKAAAILADGLLLNKILNDQEKRLK